MGVIVANGLMRQANKLECELNELACLGNYLSDEERHEYISKINELHDEAYHEYL